jgi:hypothetical protein
MNKRLILTTIPAVLALCLMSACNKPESTSAPGAASPSTQSASSPAGASSTP